MSLSMADALIEALTALKMPEGCDHAGIVGVEVYVINGREYCEPCAQQGHALLVLKARYAGLRLEGLS